ncbi:DMT family transporter [Bosea sp. 117]|uniref:DMT family transporter n=1 Tax=Bosea sp. 117 TaxID=1125973 RepID=UPI000493CB4C|nr:DMT family transporter [Bosea sp. 117]
MLLNRLGPATTAVIGIGSLSLMDGIIKHAAAGYATSQAVMMRYMVGAFVAFLVFRLTRTAWPALRIVRPHAWRAVLVVSTAVTFFYALVTLPLAVTLALSFTSPIFIAIAATVLLGERPGGNVVIALVLGFAGVLVVLWDELARTTGEGTLGILAALASAVTYALSMVTLKTRAGRDPIPTIVLLQNGFAGLFVAPFGIAQWSSPSPTETALFAVIGILGAGGHLCMASAYGRADASRLGVLEYTAFVWAVAIGFFAFGEIPSLGTVAGAALIVTGAWLASRTPPQVAPHEPDAEIGP